MRRATLPYASLPNILAGRFVVPEILQDDATPENLAQALLNQIGDKVVRGRQEQAFLDLHRQLRQNTHERLLDALLPLIARRGGTRPATMGGASPVGT
jgi:lipid-A-disaccharide synthase